MAETKSITVDVSLTEDESSTEARALLRLGDTEHTGSGVARRNPKDPNVPVVGEELATARALSDLSHHLVDAAAGAIENFTGHPVALEE